MGNVSIYFYSKSIARPLLIWELLKKIFLKITFCAILHGTNYSKNQRIVYVDQTVTDGTT